MVANLFFMEMKLIQFWGLLKRNKLLETHCPNQDLRRGSDNWWVLKFVSLASLEIYLWLTKYSNWFYLKLYNPDFIFTCVAPPFFPLPHPSHVHSLACCYFLFLWNLMHLKLLSLFRNMNPNFYCNDYSIAKYNFISPIFD